MQEIQMAQLADCTILTEITFRSKSHWGYSATQMELWRQELKVTANYLDEYSVFLLKENGRTIGYYGYKAIDLISIKLDNLFVDQNYIGKGFGKTLLLDCLDRAKSNGYNSVRLDSDPNAVNFYLKYGFTIIGKLETSIPCRFLSIMELPI